MGNIIEIKGVAKAFGALKAVDGIDLHVQRGEMFCLVGPDGAGKTSLVRMLCGILKPDTGTLSVLGHDTVRNAAAVKGSIGYLSQQFSLYGDLSVDENIAFFAELHGVANFEERRDELLAFTRLTPFRSRLADRLSGGMKQKLALACTLVHTPEIIFLDEPTTGVDPVSRRDFWKILADLLRRDITIFMTTPYLDEAERCTRVALMDHGKIMTVDTPDALRAVLKGRVVEVMCSRARDAVRLLREAALADEVQLFGDRLLAVLPAGDDAAGKMQEYLTAQNIDVQGVRMVTPSLENVFISMVRKSGDAE